MMSDCLGFKVQEVFKSHFQWEASYIEDEIQRRILYLELGTHHLFRGVGNGQKYADKFKLPRVRRVLLTCSTKIQQLIKDRVIIVDL